MKTRRKSAQGTRHGGPAVHRTVIADKRQLVRMPLKGRLLIAFWESDRFFFGRLQDGSLGGLGFWVRQIITPGSLLLVQADEPVGELPFREIGKGSCCEITWFKEWQWIDDFRFRIGARFADPCRLERADKPGPAIPDL